MNRRLYIGTAFFAALGVAYLWPFHGTNFALAFLFGALVSMANLFLFDRLSHAISPEGGQKRPWQAAAFITRYLLMFGGGYVIVKALGVNPLPVLLGLLASTAAAVAVTLIELFEPLINGK